MSEKTYTAQKGLNAKDLITTGIFSALLFIAVMIGGVLLAINPITAFCSTIGSGLLGGPIFLLLVAKVPKRGSIIIAGIMLGMVFFITGMHWGMYLGYIVCGIIADFIAGIKKYKSKTMNSLAYMILSFGGIGSLVVYLIDPAAWSAVMLEGGSPKNYIHTLTSLASPFLLIVTLASTAFTALLSAWGGTILLKKQFEKAGITA